MDKRVLRLLFSMTTIVALLSCSMAIMAMAADPESVTVFAAASTTNALTISARYLPRRERAKLSHPMPRLPLLPSKSKTGPRPMCSFPRMSRG